MTEIYKDPMQDIGQPRVARDPSVELDLISAVFDLQKKHRYHDKVLQLMLLSLVATWLGMAMLFIEVRR